MFGFMRLRRKPQNIGEDFAKALYMLGKGLSSPTGLMTAPVQIIEFQTTAKRLYDIQPDDDSLFLAINRAAGQDDHSTLMSLSRDVQKACKTAPNSYVMLHRLLDAYKPTQADSIAKGRPGDKVREFAFALITLS